MSLRQIVTFLFYMTCALFGGLAFIWIYVGKDLPDTDYLKDYAPPSMARVFDRRGDMVQEWAKERRVFISISKVPPLVIHAFLCAEDKNFLIHPGIDFIGLVRAMISNTMNAQWHQRPKGASTITQQVTKNFLVGNEQSFSRKLKEAILSLRLEQELSKKRILELYLNQIYLGRGCYGIVCAAKDYFGKRLDQLSPAECAFLASLPKAPSALQDPKKALKRRNWVLTRMIKDGVLNPTYGELHKREALVVKDECSFSPDYFLEEVRRILSNKPDLYSGGWSIFTTLDSKLQNFATESLRQGLEDYDARFPYRGPYARVNLTQPQEFPISPVPFLKTALVLEKTDHDVVLQTSLGHRFRSDSLWRESLVPGDVVLTQHQKIVQFPEVTGGIVVLDADTGEVLALSGGYDPKISQFNCATQAWRQAGSTFKPFVYMTALSQGYTPDTKILDAPIRVSLGPGLGFYKPKNITGQSYGPTPLHVGFEKSRNLVTVRLAQSVGMSKIRDMAFRFRVLEKFPLQLAMSLGAGETTLLRLCAAYARMINGGFDIEPHFLKREVPLNGMDAHTFAYPKVLFDIAPHTPLNWHNTIPPESKDFRKRIIGENLSKVMTALLRGAVTQGTAKRLLPLQRTYPIVLGGKTGTTNECKDAWFIGFVQTPAGKTCVVGVFVGFKTPKSLGPQETGSKLALPIFESFVKKAAPYLLSYQES